MKQRRIPEESIPEVSPKTSMSLVASGLLFFAAMSPPAQSMYEETIAVLNQATSAINIHP